jgi:hypothetical protein
MGSLESRLLLSRQVGFPDGVSFIFPTFRSLPRTGGALIQSGTALTLGVGQRTSNTVNITDAGLAAQTVEWNGRAQHDVDNTHAFLVQARASRRDLITIDLGASPAFASPAASSTTTATGVPREQSYLLSALLRPRTGPTVVLSGSLLNITITSRKINEISISSSGAGQVEAQWKRGAAQMFTGVSTIIVDIRNGTPDFVALDNTIVDTA